MQNQYLTHFQSFKVGCDIEKFDISSLEEEIEKLDFKEKELDQDRIRSIQEEKKLKTEIEKLKVMIKTLGYLEGFVCNLKRQFQGQQTRGEHGKKTLPAFAARLLKSTNARQMRGVLLSALSAIATPSAGTLQNLCTCLGKGAGARGGDGGERGQEKNQKICVTMLVDN